MTQGVERAWFPRVVRRQGLDSVAITWSDGHDCRLPNRYLRDNCPCAACRESRHGYVLPLAGGEAPHPTRIVPVGRYALGVQWSDGHDSGIYSYETLRSLCPCDGCAEPLPT